MTRKLKDILDNVPAPDHNQQVISYAKRIESLETEKTNIAQDIKAVYEEAHANGVDKKALKIAIKAKQKEKDYVCMKKVNQYLEAMGDLPLFASLGDSLKAA